MNDAVDTVILHQELAYADSLPLRVLALAEAPGGQTLAAWAERNLRLLQSCAALEEMSAGESTDDTTPVTADLQRIEMKVNLLLDMVGMLVANLQSRPAAKPLRFNAQGLLWEPGDDAVPAVGTPVQVEVYLRDSILYPLVLTGVLEDTGVAKLASVQIDALPTQVSDQIKKLVFRRHRRQIAVARAARSK